MERDRQDDELQAVIEAVRGFYARKDYAHDLAHALRVRHWGRRLAIEEGADSMVVELAALLHDIGRSGTVEKSHAASSAGLAGNILKKLGYNEFVIKRVQEAVAAHSCEDGCEPSSLEAKILYDADKLDFVGAIGLARLFTMAGVERWPLIGEKSCQTFFEERIRGYGKHLYTVSGRHYFEPLFNYMEEFWRQFHVEWLKLSSSGHTKCE